MALPILTPVSTTSLVVLPATGTYSEVNDGCVFKIYSDTSSDLYSTDFITGACQQVSYVYNMMGGNILDLEIQPSNVYSSYESAILEYSSIVNMHQAKNSISSLLGQTTGTFDSNGLIKSGSILSGTHVELKYPRFSFGYAKKVTDGVGTLVGVGGSKTIYSASFDIIENVQDYDLQSIISSSALTASSDFYNKVGNKRIVVQKVFYVTPAAVWRFFGIYGGLNVVGNLINYNPYGYGQYSDATTYEVVPVWEHKLQAKAYEDNIYTRCSHYSYEIKNNKLRIFPIPVSVNSMTPHKFWINFYIDTDSIESDNEGQKDNINGINNMNTLPFENLPFYSINSIGKMWIKKYSLALCKEVLSSVRGKFNPLRIPAGDVTLNAEQLAEQAKNEKEELKEELKKILDELTMAEIAKREADIADSTQRSLQTLPNLIYVG